MCKMSGPNWIKGFGFFAGDSDEFSFDETSAQLKSFKAMNEKRIAKIFIPKIFDARVAKTYNLIKNEFEIQTLTKMFIKN